MRIASIVLALTLGFGLLIPAVVLAVDRDDRGGVLYLALAPELKFDPYAKYCGLSGTPLPSQAVTQGEVGAAPQVAFIVASWPDSAHPELGGVAFGLRYPRGIEILRWGTCQRTLTAPTSTFPLSGEGLAIALAGGTTDTSRTIEIAWLVVAARNPGRLELVPHPSPLFASHFSTASGPTEAPIAGLGYLGFGEPGDAPAPQWPGPALGAACVMDSICARITKKECDYYGSSTVWFGEGVYCTSDICGREAPTGACCLPDGTCQIMKRRSCVLQAGSYLGDGSACVPDPCPSEKGSGVGKGSE